MSEKSLIRAVFFALTLSLVVGLTGCCGGLKMRGGEYCDNLFTPNSYNRHAKFVRWLNASVGETFPTDIMCNFKYTGSEIVDKDHMRYVYSYRPGCKYYCVVDSRNTVVGISFDGAKDACYLQLN